MFTSFVGWVKNLSKAGKVALGVVVIGAASAMAAPQQPSVPATESNPQVFAASQITTETVTETQPVAFTKKTQEDGNINKGVTKVITVGVNGVKTLTYKVTKSDSVETKRELVTDEIRTQPTDEVTSVGTYVVPVVRAAPVAPQSNCDPNYSGACVPIASDVDCGGGSGNGPAYVYGTVTVIGTDIYDLDRDGDGYGCE